MSWAGRKPTADEWRVILESHARWMCGDGGERADLSGANLSGADLSGATGDLPTYRFQIVPDAGAFIGWKKLRDGLIAQLEIPATAGRVGGLLGRKCRASKARVLAIWRGKKREPSREGFSLHDESFAYRVGKIVAPEDGWCDDPRVECAAGIHFYITRREAEEHA